MKPTSTRGFSNPETAALGRLPFDSPFGIFFAAVSYFGFHGLEIKIDSQSPVKSALGGSSTALVALRGALHSLAASDRNSPISKRAVLHQAYHLEDGISGGNCGIQDQAAAVYGGVHLWKWHFGQPDAPLTGHSLLDERGRGELGQHLLVAYSGRSHVAASTAFFLREEMAVRRQITPEALDPVTEEMVTAAENADCGGRFAGAGAGGSVWALGSRKNIETLREKWREMLLPIQEAHILETGIDGRGVRRE